MQLTNTELKAVEALLEYGIKERATAPLLLRLFGKRTVPIVIRPPFMGTMYRISQINCKAGLTPEVLEAIDLVPLAELHKKYSWPMAKVAALGMVPGWLTGLLLMWPIAAWLRWHLKPHQLARISKAMHSLNGKTSFTNTIRYVSGMQITTPNLSQQSQGS